MLVSVSKPPSTAFVMKSSSKAVTLAPTSRSWAEMRAGRSTIEAIESLADRLGLDEAASFNTRLRQSLELGSDIGEALRIYIQ